MPDMTRTQVLTEEDADRKAEMTLKIRDLWEQGQIWPPAAGGDGWHRGHPLLPRQPARPGHVTLVEPSRVKQGNRAAFVHTLVHAESYAIDLMWDLMARFGGEGGGARLVGEGRQTRVDRLTLDGMPVVRVLETGAGVELESPPEVHLDTKGD